MKYDINDLQFRTLRADEIELRVGTVSAKGASLLLYQDSRCAMSRLDEIVGRGNWQRDHKEVKGNMYCGIAIWDFDKNEWVWKWDCGTESNTEKEKGESSDSFKRASVNWGIGRELYTSPFVFIQVPTQRKQNGKGYELADPYVFSGAKVVDIDYDENRCISALTIADKSGTVMYSYPRGGRKMAPKAKPEKELTPADMITAEDAKKLKDALEATGSDTAKFLDFISKTIGHKVESVDGMTYTEYDLATQAINAKMRKGNA